MQNTHARTLKWVQRVSQESARVRTSFDRKYAPTHKQMGDNSTTVQFNINRNSTTILISIIIIIYLFILCVSGRVSVTFQVLYLHTQRNTIQIGISVTCLDVSSHPIILLHHASHARKQRSIQIINTSQVVGTLTSMSMCTTPVERLFGRRRLWMTPCVDWPLPVRLSFSLSLSGEEGGAEKGKPKLVTIVIRRIQR